MTQLITVSLMAVLCFILGVIAAFYMLKYFLYEIIQFVTDEVMSIKIAQMEEENADKGTD